MSYYFNLKIVHATEMTTVKVKTTDTILQIKWQIATDWNVPVEDQVLHISSQRLFLQDDKTLADYDIITDATIDFLIRVEDPT